MEVNQRLMNNKINRNSYQIKNKHRKLNKTNKTNKPKRLIHFRSKVNRAVIKTLKVKVREGRAGKRLPIINKKKVIYPLRHNYNKIVLKL